MQISLLSRRAPVAALSVPAAGAFTGVAHAAPVNAPAAGAERAANAARRDSKEICMVHLLDRPPCDPA